MFKEVLQAMAGVGIWPTIALLFFMAAFILMLFWVMRLDKEEIRHAAHLPLEDSDQPNTPRSQNREVS